jgi:hypothetical protein
LRFAFFLAVFFLALRFVAFFLALRLVAFFLALRLVAFFFTLRLAFFLAARFFAGRLLAAFLRVAFLRVDVFLAAARFVVAFLDVVLRFETSSCVSRTPPYVSSTYVALLPFSQLPYFRFPVCLNTTSQKIVVTMTWLRSMANVDHLS